MPIRPPEAMWLESTPGSTFSSFAVSHQVRFADVRFPAIHPRRKNLCFAILSTPDA
jgi:hypothetical protein